jgi:hypothetical protein
MDGASVKCFECFRRKSVFGPVHKKTGSGEFGGELISVVVKVQVFI